MTHERIDDLPEAERAEMHRTFWMIAKGHAWPGAIQSVSAALHYRSPWSVLEPLLKRMWRSE